MKLIEEIKKRIKILTEQEAEAIKQGDLECAVRCNVAGDLLIPKVISFLLNNLIRLSVNRLYG